MFKGNGRLIDIILVVFISTFIGMLSGGVAMYSIDHKIDKAYDYRQVSKIKEIDNMYNTIVNEYYDEVDKDKLVEGAVSGMLSVLDEHTSYMNQKAANNFNNKITGEYYGVGLEVLTLNDTGILVVNVIKDSPAYNAGIKANDIITKVNDESLKENDASFFTRLVSKSKDEIKLLVSRDGRELDFSIVPEKVVIPSVSTNIFDTSGKKIGYIKISIFAANTVKQFSEKLNKLEENGIDALVIDVRDNAGGYLSSATSILELFMNKGDVLYSTESKTSTIDRKDETDENRNYKVAVLINNASASASEILAACFKENKNSEIIGVTSYGKGTVQETIDVLDGSKAKLTTKKWLTPNGNWINEVGITPTIVAKQSEVYLKNPTFDNDNQLEVAIKSLLK
ncbi:MAG: S41 family peptidase [Bacilli bacterium]|nr:S41 family peptidase [Bacilli bacterium]